MKRSKLVFTSLTRVVPLYATNTHLLLTQRSRADGCSTTLQPRRDSPRESKWSALRSLRHSRWIWATMLSISRHSTRSMPCSFPSMNKTCNRKLLRRLSLPKSKPDLAQMRVSGQRRLQQAQAKLSSKRAVRPSSSVSLIASSKMQLWLNRFARTCILFSKSASLWAKEQSS